MTLDPVGLPGARTAPHSREDAKGGSRMSSCRFVSTTEPRVVAGRHATPCACDDRELGCLPCPETHCAICGKAHAKAACIACLDAARSDLKAIMDLCSSLPAEAVEKGVQSEAMMLLGPVADPQAWQHRYLAAAYFQRFDASYLEDCRDELHPLWVLGTWEQVWRDHLDHYSDSRISVAGSYAYLDMQIGYMAEQTDPPFDEFARELRGCRAHLENVLHDGIREERGQVPCVDCEMRLIKVYAAKEADDHWLCPHCRRSYTDQEYARAQHFHMETERADRFVKVSVALGMIDRPEQTLRTWIRVGHVRTARDAKGGILVWWPDVRTMNLNAKRRVRTDQPTYSGTHQRNRRLVGSATEYRCVDCGEQALHWSYDHNAASNELLDDRGYPFATSLAHYSPRCATCHARFDSASA